MTIDDLNNLLYWSTPIGILTFKDLQDFKSFFKIDSAKEVNYNLCLAYIEVMGERLNELHRVR